eukprot:CAMPEP_0185754894 /NCGR_PEP_ID=MMETSP1174-20130828/13471_1 /TAXON_ID=35687 /ORGANISM="Dictyocha speculum, Strain CCMP1381" /LENGTH=287 /DNA_ID=CAMNT_0028433279 /DNA_START=10 /DNA_END=874 /DNA_ORIENTATION=+
MSMFDDASELQWRGRGEPTTTAHSMVKSQELQHEGLFDHRAPLTSFDTGRFDPLAKGENVQSHMMFSGQEQFKHPLHKAPPAAVPGSVVPPELYGPTTPELFDKADGEGRWSRWVVVFGLPVHEKDADIMTVRSFMAMGEVIESHRGSGNFIFLKFATALQATRALAQNPTFLSSTSLVGVTALTPDKAEKLGFRFREDGTAMLTGGIDSVGNRVMNRNASATYKGSGHYQMRHGMQRRPYMIGDDMDILQPPRRHVNICKQIMQWLFNWKHASKNTNHPPDWSDDA